MRAVGVLPQQRRVAVVSHPEPRNLAPHEVKLRILEVGVCGTDKDIVAFRHGTAPEGSDYLVLGHESLAEVAEIGSAVEGLCAGDLVVGMVRLPCPHSHCVPCRSGRQDFCVTGDYRERGIKDLHGFMTEFVVEQEQYLHRLPPELRDIGVLVEPLTIAEKAFRQAVQAQQRAPWSDGPKTAVVLGAGPVGLLGAMLLVKQGFRTWVYSQTPEPNASATICARIGARYVSSEIVAPRALAAMTGSIDLVYEALGAAQLAFDVLPLLGANGIYVFTGIPRRGENVTLALPELMANLILKNQAILGTVNAGRDAFAAAAGDLADFRIRWPEAVRALITARYPLEEFLEPITGLAAGIKNVISIAH